MRRLAWVLLALAAAYVVFIGGAWLGIYTTELRVITVGLTGLVLLGWAVAAWRNPFWRPRTAMAPAFVACFASLTIATVTSRIPRISLEYLGYAILLGALYLFLVRLMASPFFRERLVSLGALLFVGISAYFLVFVAYLWVQWWITVGHLTVPPLRPNFIGLGWGNPSAVLTMVTLCAVPAAAKWSSWSGRGIAVFLGIGFVVGLVAILTGSRAGWFALGIAGAVGVLAGISTSGVRTRAAQTFASRGTLPRGVWVFVSLGAVAVIGIFVFTLPAIVARATSGGEDVRATFYVTALRMFQTSPLFGTGLGTWVIQRIAFTQAPETDYYIPHAHDVPLQTLAEQGLVGAVAGLVLVANLGLLLWSAARSEDGSRRRWAWLTALGLVYFAAHNLLDFYPNMPAILLPAVLPVAYLDATASETGRVGVRPLPAPTRGLGRAGLVAGIVVMVVATAGLLVQEIPAMQESASIEAASRNDWARAYATSSAAADSDPYVSPYDFTAGLDADRVGDHQAALMYFDRVAKQDDLPDAWVNLAAEQAAAGQRDAAIDSIRRALRLGIQHVQIAIPAGELAFRLGQRDLAIQALAYTVGGTPSFAADPWWHADPDRAALFPDVIAAASAQASTYGQWEIALMAGDSEAASRIAATLPDPADVQLFISAWTGSDTAFETLLQECADRPLDLTAQEWCGRLEHRRGNETDAARFRDIVETLSAGASLAALELRVLPKDVVGPYAISTTTYGWFFYTYRRPGAPDMLVPSLVHVYYG